MLPRSVAAGRAFKPLNLFPIVACAFLLLAPHSRAQQSVPGERGAPQPVIRAESRLVLVDLVVRDKKGTAGGLTAADFRLWEDGKERPVTGLSTESSSETPRRDYLVFLFDGTAGSAAIQTATMLNVRKDVAKFAGAYASPDRYMAVLNFGGIIASIAQNLTARTERIQQAALAAVAFTGSPEASGAYAQVPVTSSIADASSADPGANLSLADRRRIEDNAGRGGGQLGRIKQLPILDAIVAVADSMAVVRGRKSLIVIGFGQATQAGTATQYDAAKLACNRANVALYVTDGMLKGLAETTGGRLIQGDLVRSLSEIADEQAKRYILSFTPSESPDGSCHALRVEAKRGGLDVHARSSYCNRKPPDLLAGTSTGKSLEADATAARARNATMTLPFFYNAPNAATVHLVMELDLPTLKFARRDGKQQADLDVVALVYGPGGELAGKFSDTANIDLATAEEVKIFRSRPYHYERQIDLPSGKYNVQVAFGSGGESLGKVEALLTIEAWDGLSLALSGIALSRTARKASDLAADIDPSLLESNKPLIARSLEVMPSGHNRFRNTEPCFGYVELYDAALARPNARAPRLAIRLLDKRTSREILSGETDLAEFLRPGSPSAPVLLRVPVQQLSAGAYTLEMRASSDTRSAFRSLDFEVE